MQKHLRQLIDGLSWRWDLYRSKRFLYRNFRNGKELYESWIHRTVCDTAVFRDGTILRHPLGETGFAGLLLEIYGRCVYTGKFYQPKPGDFVVDAGANIGTFAVQIHRLCPTATVAAYEPFPENFDYLQSNLDAAKAKNVIAHRMALGGKRKVCSIQRVGSRSQDHRVVESDGYSECSSGGGVGTLTESATSVQVASFSELFHEAHGREIDLFKCDIEGSELELFQSATPDELARVKRVAVEFHDHIQPGTSLGIMKLLQPTHDVYLRDVSDLGYGMLYGVRRF